MKQIWITKAGGPEVFHVRETEPPKLAQDAVLIHVRASGVNLADMLARKGLYPGAPGVPCVVA